MQKKREREKKARSMLQSVWETSANTANGSRKGSLKFMPHLPVDEAEYQGTPKDVVFVLDYSGSMSGNRIKACVENILSIYDHCIFKPDRCAFICFASRIEHVFDLQSKSDAIRQELADSIKPSGGTYFRAAVQDAMMLLKIHTPSSHETARGQWIIALTDGVDNG